MTRISSLSAALDRAEKHCIEQGSKLTEKRRQVLSGLLNSDKALSAYEISDLCSTQLGANLLPMSVYRILDFLESKNLVHRLNLANKYVACSHIAFDHKNTLSQFLICKSCYNVEEVRLPASLISFIEDGAKTAGYKLVSNQLELECVCSDCPTNKTTS